jgi:signal transduction histidine kinase
MISDLLDFARTRLGDKLPLAPAPMNLCDSCKAAVDEIAILHDGRAFSFDSPCEYTGEWDRARVEQMLSNLIGNAAQHGKPGTPVRVTAGEKDGFVSVSVHNEGNPIPRSQFRRIFEPLAHGPETEMKISSGGRSLGLGLYIAREIAKAHGGRLELTSSNESGTVFTALLPR